MLESNSETSFDPKLLNTKTALVTAAGSGIGRECVVALVNAGAQVIAVARTESALNSLQNELPEGAVEIWVNDATSNDFFERLAAKKDIHILVNNLGLNKPQPFVDVSADTLSRLVEINFTSLFKTTQIVVKNMLSEGINGSVVNMSSQMGHIGSPNRTVYCSVKHAVEGLTKSLAVELAEQNIRVNAVAPTFVETEATRPMLDNPDFKQFVYDSIPMKRLASTSDVANAVVFLASKLSNSVTGTSLKVDGGWTAQ